MYIFIISLLTSLLFNQVLTDNSFNTSRSIGLAGATVSNPGKYESVFSNPAYLSDTKNSAILLGRTNYYELDLLKYSYFSFIYRDSKPTSKLNFAFTIQELGTKPTYTKVQNFLSIERAITLSQGYSFFKDRNSSLSIGYNLNYLMLDQGASAGASGDGSDGISSKKITSFGIDVGLFATLRDKVMMGAFIKNINSPSLGRGKNSHYLPRRLNIGFSYMPIKKLKTSFEFQRSIGTKNNQFRIAILYNLFENFTFRVGGQLKPNRFGAGFTFNVNGPFNALDNDLTFSYGFITHPVMPLTHNFEFGVLIK